jgi:hypothetical protein
VTTVSSKAATLSHQTRLIYCDPSASTNGSAAPDFSRCPAAKRGWTFGPSRRFRIPAG